MRPAISAALIMFQAGGIPGAAQAAMGAPSTCNVTAMLLGEPNKPTAVFERPTEQSPVAGHLPPRLVFGEQSRGPKVRILSAQNGWLKIQVQGDVEDEGLPPRPMYVGEGWVYAPLVYLNIDSDRAFQRPDPRSGPAFSLDNLSMDGYLPSETVVSDCVGDWALVTMKFSSRLDNARGPIERTGWIRGICDHFETSCDGIVAD